MDGWYENAKRLPLTTQEFYAVRAVPLISIVDHVTAGTDSRDWLQHADNQSSVHFLIRVEGVKAVVYQFLSVNRGAWGNGRYSSNNPYMPAWVKSLIARGININHATVSIEHEKPVPFNDDMHPLMLAESIKLHRWLIAEYPTIKPTREFVIGHYAIDGVNRAFCPGGPGGEGFPFEAILSALQGAPQPPQPPPTNQTAIQAYAATHGYVGLPLWGAERVMTLEDGRDYQCVLYERALLHWRAGEGVGEARIGAMWEQAVEAIGG